MPWGAAIGAIGAIGGAYLSSDASRSAGNAQVDAANQANQLQRDQFNQTSGNLAPYRQAGTQALSQLQGIMGQGPGGLSAVQGMVAADPSYQFNLSQGQQEIDKAAAARGNFYAPQTLQDLGKYSQGLASNEYGNIWQRLFSVAGAGQNAAVQQGGFGAGAAGAMGNNTMQAGNAQAAGIIGQNNAWTTALSQIGGLAYNQANKPNFGQYDPSITGGGMGSGWDSGNSQPVVGF